MPFGLKDSLRANKQADEESRSGAEIPLPTPIISENFLPSHSIWRKLRICRDLFYLSYGISWLGICTTCRKKLAMLTKGVAANKTDEDEAEVRRSSRMAEKSPVSFENLLLPPETPLPFGQESSLGETPETPGYQPYAIHRVQSVKKKMTPLRSLMTFWQVVTVVQCGTVLEVCCPRQQQALKENIKKS